MRGLAGNALVLFFSSDSEPSHTFAQLSKQVANNLSFTVLGHVDGTFFHFHARARGDAQSVIESGMEVRDGHGVFDDAAGPLGRGFAVEIAFLESASE